MEKKLHHLEIHPVGDGEHHVVEHHYTTSMGGERDKGGGGRQDFSGSFPVHHEQEDRAFGEDEHTNMMEHVHNKICSSAECGGLQDTEYEESSGKGKEHKEVSKKAARHMVKGKRY